MAEKDIIQNLIFQLGQSQDDRLPKELDGHFADIDEKSTADLLHQTKIFAQDVRYYQNNTNQTDQNWSNFFPDDDGVEQLLQNTDANTTPHLALYLAFLELYKQPQSLLNKITTRHLDFYYQEVLRLSKKAAIPDKVHLLLELKKNMPPTQVGPEHKFSAGSDATNTELTYLPTRNSIINAAKVESLRSLFFNTDTRLVHYATAANSADGLGQKLAEQDLKWSGFGSQKMPETQIGFAIASPVLQMKEGIRKVKVYLSSDNAQFTNLQGAFIFDVMLTSEKGWTKAYSTSSKFESGKLVIEFTIPKTELAIINYDPSVHGGNYQTIAPIAQFIWHGDSRNYPDFSTFVIKDACIEIQNSAITSLHLENDDGAINPQKAFLPFGSQPTIDSQFQINYPETSDKKITNIGLTIQWKNAPADFASYYTHYQKNEPLSLKSRAAAPPRIYKNPRESNPLKNSDIAAFKASAFNNGYFTAKVSFRNQPLSDGEKLFNITDATQVKTFDFILSADSIEQSAEFISLSLEKDFLHSTYRQNYVENVMKASQNPNLLVTFNEPYTPTIQNISLSYGAKSAVVAIDATTLEEFNKPELHFFHIIGDGQMRVHGYQQTKANLPTKTTLFPSINHNGELFIGLSQLHAGDSVNILFQVAEGSANPELSAPQLQWFVLCDNYWQALSSAEVVLDTTNRLLTSGIIQFIIPGTASTENTLLPSGLLWIKAAITGDVTAVCQLLEVAANAIEVKFVDQGNETNHLATALAAGKITKLQTGIAAIKTVKQPYASFSGAAPENDRTFNARVAERLRHKNRCITSWDYERITLAAFPKIHKVKCIPHANDNSWLAPGHILIVVVPDLKKQNTMNLLTPKVDAATIQQITSHLQARAGMQVKIKVKNPKYQKIKLDFKVKFHPGYEANYYRAQLTQEIIRFLSPWAYQTEQELSFGGRIYKSVILNFIEELAYVDYLTDFKMMSNNEDLNEVIPRDPDTILVADETHNIVTL
jgi:hypothetical protein